MLEQDTAENRQRLIKEMVERLEQEGVDEAEVLSFKEFAANQPYDRLRQDSLVFWTMRV